MQNTTPPPRRRGRFPLFPTRPPQLSKPSPVQQPASSILTRPVQATRYSGGRLR